MSVYDRYSSEKLDEEIANLLELQDAEYARYGLSNFWYALSKEINKLVERKKEIDRGE
jgi:hypothetical protein